MRELTLTYVREYSDSHRERRLLWGEHFDAWGEYRTTDNGFEVDATGSIPVTTVEVDGAPELAAAFSGEFPLDR